MGATMTIQTKLSFCIFLVFVIICSAISISGGHDEMMNIRFGGKNLKMSLDDYDETSANRGHDPKSRNGDVHGDGTGRSGGRRGF